MEIPEFDVEISGDDDQQTKAVVLPAYEIVKRSILWDWIRIKAEYKDFIFFASTNKSFRTEKLSSNILTLYETTLRSMFLHMKVKGFDEFVVEMDSYKDEIPADKIKHVIRELSSFLYKVGLLNIAHEIQPWEESWRASFPV